MALTKGTRVRHKFGHAGVIVTGRYRNRDGRVLVLTDEGDRLWCDPFYLNNDDKGDK